MISACWYCLLLWQILILGGACEQEGSGGGDISICARKLYILIGDKSDGCSKKISLYITRLVLFIILEGLKLDVVCNTIFRCGVVNNVLKLHNLLLCTCIAR